jgi:hypothetical protein
MAQPRKVQPYQIINYYERIPKEEDDMYSYPNYDRMQIKIPMRAIIQGPSGSGKTIIAVNLIAGIGIWDKVIILAKDLGEPLYRYLIKEIQAMEKKQKRRILLAIDKIVDLPSLDAFNRNENTLFIVDDFVADDPKSLRPLEEIWIRGRKMSISSIFISQSYFDTPKKIRKNSDYVFIKQLGNPLDMARIAKEYAMGKTAKEIKDLYDRVMSGADVTDFFLIDRNNQDRSMQFRDGFGPIQ